MPNVLNRRVVVRVMPRLLCAATLVSACSAGPPPGNPDAAINAEDVGVDVAIGPPDQSDAATAVDSATVFIDASMNGVVDASTSADASPHDAGDLDATTATPDSGTAVTDGGATTCGFDENGPGVWEARPFPPTTHTVSDLVFAPNGDAYVTVFQEGVYMAHAPCYDDFTLIYDAPTGGWRRIVRTAAGAFIATGTIGSGLTAQVARSVDGLTFEDITGRFPHPLPRMISSFYSAAYNPQTDVVFVGVGWLLGENIVYRSLDDGETWSYAALSPAHNDGVARVATGIVAGPGSRVAVGTEGAGLWVSYDDGVTFPGWIAMPDPMFQGRESRVGPNGLIYVSVDNDSGGNGGLYRGSAEHSSLASFDKLALPPGLNPLPSAAHWAAQVIAYGFVGDVLFVVAARTGMVRSIALSHDFGGTFVDYSSGYATTTPNGIVLGPDGHAYGYGVNGAFYRSRAPFP